MIKNTPNNQTLFFGKYEQNDGIVAPIEWIVLAGNKESLLLISKEVLDYKQFHYQKEDVTWENSDLRKWLNNEFYNSAFTVEQQKRIIPSSISFDSMNRRTKRNEEKTTDNIFLLSTSEVRYYFFSISEQVSHPTDFAISHGVPISAKSHNGSAWFLRSKGRNFKYVAAINPNGTFNKSGLSVDTSCGIRPALWLKPLSVERKAINENAQTSLTNPISRPVSINVKPAVPKENEPSIDSKVKDSGKTSSETDNKSVDKTNEATVQIERTIVEESPYEPKTVEVTQLENGNILFGHYEQEIGKISPIEWIILEDNETEVLLLSKYVLDYRAFNFSKNLKRGKKRKNYKGVIWSTSTIRDWIKTSFFNRAFTEEEKEFICASHLSTISMNTSYEFVSETLDKVFLLSGDEINRFSYYPHIKLGITTPYAHSLYLKEIKHLIAEGEIEGEINITPLCGWWLRSQEKFGRYGVILVINNEGNVGGDMCLDNEKYGIRPAMRLCYNAKNKDTLRMSSVIYKKNNRKEIYNMLPNGNILFGRYETGDEEFKPIEWIVLDKRPEGYLIISKEPLFYEVYNFDNYDNGALWKDITWENCTIRKILNSYFYFKAFTQEEKECIEPVMLTNSDNPVFGTLGGENTEDRIFLLSLEEKRRYLHEEDCLIKTTETEVHNEKQSFLMEDTDFDDLDLIEPNDLDFDDDDFKKREWNFNPDYWWLRSPGMSEHRACFVHNGISDEEGNAVSDNKLGIRPVLFLKVLPNDKQEK